MLKHLLGESQSQPEIKSTQWSILKFKNNISIPYIVHVSFGKSCLYLKVVMYTNNDTFDHSFIYLFMVSEPF